MESGSLNVNCLTYSSREPDRPCRVSRICWGLLWYANSIAFRWKSTYQVSRSFSTWKCSKRELRRYLKSLQTPTGDQSMIVYDKIKLSWCDEQKLNYSWHALILIDFACWKLSEFAFTWNSSPCCTSVWEQNKSWWQKRSLVNALSLEKYSNILFIYHDTL